MFRSKFGVTAMPLRCSQGNLKSSYWKASEKPIWLVSSKAICIWTGYRRENCYVCGNQRC